ncbi:MAG: ATP-binding cassette domain-containing protein [Rhodobacteraceae bacterium]|nr:ATP-binding cassette domain-containing protein [Paracoccaceae bacterium]
MLTLEDVSIVAGTFHLTANCSVPEHSLTAVIGPSGAGKSTLLSAIAGFQDIAAGQIFWNKTPISGLPPGKRPVSTIFQDGNLFPHLTAFQNVGLGISPALKLSAQDENRVAEVLGRVGLTGMEARKPGALSGGQQSRVALARVLVQNRPVVLLDEPFSALGPAMKAEMLDLTKALLTATEATVLMVTHDPEDARRIAEHTMVVSDGQVAPPEPTRTLFANPTDALRAYIGP